MRPVSRRLAVLVLCGLVAACSGGPTRSPAPSPTPLPSVPIGPTSAPSPSPAPPSPAPPSPAPSSLSGEILLTVGGDRPVTVHVPPSHDPAGAPLLLGLHGYTSSPAELEAYFDLDRAAAERGIVYAYPEGTRDAQGNRFWNATDACCDLGRTGVDDEAYLAGLIHEIATRVAIDPRRVYVVGHSNGGFMSHRMACSHADLVAAIASLAGMTFADPAKCAPAAPVAVLQVHGTGDATILFGGGSIGALGAPGNPARYPGAAETVADWAAADGCDPTLSPSPARLDLDRNIDGPDGRPEETTVATSTGCDPGGFVELWTIERGAHVPNLSASFPDALLDFLLAHPKPGA